MKSINTEQVELIDAVLAEKEVGGLTAAIFEKDIHVTNVLHLLTALPSAHFRLVFCGGTSLAKAHGMIERMSEDIDFKISLVSGDVLSRTALNKQLKDYKQQIISTLEAMGFVADEQYCIAQNENRYFTNAWFYQSHYKNHNSLRPHLSVEFTLREPYFPIQQMPAKYLLNQFLPDDGNTTSLSCVASEEILAEKVLAFLRRYAAHKNNTKDWDSALVRHIYDVHSIHKVKPNAVTLAKNYFSALVDQEKILFTQHEEFVKNTKACLLEALTAIEADKQAPQEYKKRLLPLIYGTYKPSFEEAFKDFKFCAGVLIGEL